MSQAALLTALIACVSLLYATVGQAGGTAFLAVMAFAGFPDEELRPTALLLNVVAAGYATWRLHRRGAIEWRLLLPIAAPSLATAFLGGLVVLDGRPYFIATGTLLILAAGLMLSRPGTPAADAAPVRPLPAMLVGAAAGFLSGVTGVGGGVFLVPILVVLGWASGRQAAAVSGPFILANSTFGLAGAVAAGQSSAPATGLYAAGALVGAVIGTAIGLRWMSERATRLVLAAILLFAGVRLLLR